MFTIILALIFKYIAKIKDDDSPYIALIFVALIELFAYIALIEEYFPHH